MNRGALSAWLRKQFNGDRPWNEIVYELITAKGSNKENGAVNFALAHLEFGAVPLTSITTRRLPRPADPVHPVSRPSVERLEAGRLLGHQRVLQGDQDGAGDQGRTTPAARSRPHGAEGRADRRLRQLRQAQRPGRDRLPEVSRRPQDQPGDGRRSAGSSSASSSPTPRTWTLAKAFVNRMWGHFMGRGIVHPVDDFGPHNPPSHPELLDELAKEFATRTTTSRPCPLDHVEPGVSTEQHR